MRHLILGQLSTDTSPTHLSAEEAAVLCGVSTRSIFRWAQSGQIVSMWAYGRRWFDRSDVERLAQRRAAE